MAWFEIAFRFGAAALFLAQAVQILASRRAGLSGRFYACMVICLTGFIATHSPIDAGLAPPVRVALSVLSKTTAIFIWLFLLSLFDDRFRLAPFHLGTAGLWIALVPADFPAFYDNAPAIAALASQARIALSIVIAAHLAYRLAADWRVDLVERRRRLRLAFAVSILFLFVGDLASDFLLGFTAPPLWFSTLQKGAVFAFAFSAQFWLSHYRHDAFSLDEPRPKSVSDPAQARVLSRLTDALADGVYLEADLSVGALARRLGTSEASLRALINHQLGHRNFRTFLNQRRVDHAKCLLSDPLRARDGMIAIALDSGFASLPSFNRAFRAFTGDSPSRFREVALGSKPGSE